VSVGFVVAALVAVALAVFVTNEFVDVALLMLAVGLMIANYAARRSAREQYLYLWDSKTRSRWLTWGLRRASGRVLA
jgi:hypothetical protein